MEKLDHISALLVEERRRRHQAESGEQADCVHFPRLTLPVDDLTERCLFRCFRLTLRMKRVVQASNRSSASCCIGPLAAGTNSTKNLRPFAFWAILIVLWDSCCLRVQRACNVCNDSLWMVCDSCCARDPPVRSNAKAMSFARRRPSASCPSSCLPRGAIWSPWCRARWTPSSPTPRARTIAYVATADGLCAQCVVWCSCLLTRR